MPIERGNNVANIFRTIGASLSPQAAQNTARMISQQDDQDFRRAEAMRREQVAQQAGQQGAASAKQAKVAEMLMKGLSDGSLQGNDAAVAVKTLGTMGYPVPQGFGVAPAGPDPLKVGAVNPKDYTRESFAAAFQASDPSLLVPVPKVAEAPKPATGVITLIGPNGEQETHRIDSQNVDARMDEGWIDARQAEAEPSSSGGFTTIQRLNPETNEVETRTMRTNSPGLDALLGGGEWAIKEKGGISVRGPDGTVLQVGGTGPLGGSMELTPAQKTRQQEALFQAEDEIADYTKLIDDFDSDFLDKRHQALTDALNFVEKWGVTLDPASKQKVREHAVFLRRAYQKVNQTIAYITGAAMGEKEADRIRLQVPDPAVDGPTRFQEKARDSLVQAQQIRLRALNRLSRGIAANIDINHPDYETPNQFEMRKNRAFDRNADDIARDEPGMDPAKIAEMAGTMTDEQLGLTGAL